MPRTNYGWPEVFALMPFTANVNPMFDDHIKNAVTQRMLIILTEDDEHLEDFKEYMP